MRVLWQKLPDGTFQRLSGGGKDWVASYNGTASDAGLPAAMSGLPTDGLITTLPEYEVEEWPEGYLPVMAPTGLIDNFAVSDVFLDADGNDSNSGYAADDAVATISQALVICNRLKGHVRLHVAGGEYNLPNSLAIEGLCISEIIGDAENRPIFMPDGSTQELYILGTPDFKMLNIDLALTTDVFGGRASFGNCKFYNANAALHVDGGGRATLTSCNITINPDGMLPVIYSFSSSLYFAGSNILTRSASSSSYGAIDVSASNVWLNTNSLQIQDANNNPFIVIHNSTVVANGMPAPAGSVIDSSSVWA